MWSISSFMYIFFIFQQLKNDQEEERPGEKTDGTDGLELFADLKDFEIYSCVNPQKELGAPAALCLRRTSEQDFSNCLYFAPDSLQDQTCWLTAMRLAKVCIKCQYTNVIYNLRNSNRTVVIIL